jgi:hypothetical protein
MKKIIIALLMLMSLNSAASHEKVRNIDPKSEPEKWVFVGEASTDNVFVMFQDAVMDALDEFFEYYQSRYSTELSEEISGTFNIEFVKSELGDGALYVWLKVLPEGNYAFITSESYISSGEYSDDKKTEVHDRLRKATILLKESDEQMEIQFFGRDTGEYQKSVSDSKASVKSSLYVTLDYNKQESF